MPHFLVTFDDAAFTTDGGFDGCEIVGKDAIELSKSMKASAPFPPGVIAFESAQVSNDDAQPENGEYKVFTSIVLRIEVKNEQEADRFEPPQELLGAVLERLQGLSDGALENEGNWEVLGVEAVEPVRRAAALKKASRL